MEDCYELYHNLIKKIDETQITIDESNCTELLTEQIYKILIELKKNIDVKCFFIPKQGKEIIDHINNLLCSVNALVQANIRFSKSNSKLSDNLFSTILGEFEPTALSEESLKDANKYWRRASRRLLGEVNILLEENSSIQKNRLSKNEETDVINNILNQNTQLKIECRELNFQKKGIRNVSSLLKRERDKTSSHKDIKNIKKLKIEVNSLNTSLDKTIKENKDLKEKLKQNYHNLRKYISLSKEKILQYLDYDISKESESDDNVSISYSYTDGLSSDDESE